MCLTIRGDQTPPTELVTRWKIFRPGMKSWIKNAQQHFGSNRANLLARQKDDSVFEGIHVFVDKKDAEFAKAECGCYFNENSYILPVNCDPKDFFARGCEPSCGNFIDIPTEVYNEVFIPENAG